MSKKKYTNQQIAGAFFILIAVAIAIYGVIGARPSSTTLMNVKYASFALGFVLVAVGKKKRSK